MINTYYDVLSPNLLKKTQNLVFARETPWYATSTDYHSLQPNKHSYAWSNFVVLDGKPTSTLGESLNLIAMMLLDNVNEKLKSICRIRLGLHNISPVNQIGGIHVDENFDHRVAIFYLNDSDGDTYIYNEQYVPNNKQNYDWHQYFNNIVLKTTIMEQSTPKENKLICFDGKNYHSSRNPTNTARRVVMNITYLRD